MQEVLISIQPQWVEKILNGEKTIEIRKTMPKCELPCKVYIYCTKGKPLTSFGVKSDGFVFEELNGKVVAEFTLNTITTLWQNNKDKTSTARVIDKDVFEKQTCMTWKQYCEYHKCKNGKYPNSYAWYIEDLKIYNKPKELKEFASAKAKDYDDWLYGIYSGHRGARCSYNSYLNAFSLKKAPQSWCYVRGRI